VSSLAAQRSWGESCLLANWCGSSAATLNQTAEPLFVSTTSLGQDPKILSLKIHDEQLELIEGVKVKIVPEVHFICYLFDSNT
jgi:hypothetical protein